jgi:hypothetical protein
MSVTQSGVHTISQTVDASSKIYAAEGDNYGMTCKPHFHLVFVLGTCELTHIFVCEEKL